MTLYLHDLIVFILMLAFVFFSWRIKSVKLGLFVGVLAIAIFFLNPVRFKVDQQRHAIEFNKYFEDMPPKKEFQRPDFSQRQAAEYKQLKKQSEESQDEN